MVDFYCVPLYSVRWVDCTNLQSLSWGLSLSLVPAVARMSESEAFPLFILRPRLHLVYLGDAQMLAMIACAAALVTPSPNAAAFEALAALYPASDYSSRRNAARDAALEHAAATASPPSSKTTAPLIPLAGDQLVYGEFELDFFEQLLNAADAQPGQVFLDLGSGVGRIVLAAALLMPRLGCCHGLEILPALHDAAIVARTQFEELSDSLSGLPIADCEYSCLDLYSEGARAALGQADVCFVYAVTWARDADGQLTELSAALAERLKTGSRVITVGVTLLPAVGDVQFERIATLTGSNEETGADSIGYVFRVTRE